MDFSEIAKKAIKEKRQISLTYHSEERLVEVHALGISRAGKPCVRVYQVLGGAVFGEKTGWKMLSLSDIDKPVLLDQISLAPRPGYNPGDKGMSSIIMEI